MTDFTSEGPARLTNDLKPDISAPGYDIQSTDAGTGEQGREVLGHLDGDPARRRRRRAAASSCTRSGPRRRSRPR